MPTNVFKEEIDVVLTWDPKDGEEKKVNKKYLAKTIKLIDNHNKAKAKWDAFKIASTDTLTEVSSSTNIFSWLCALVYISVTEGISFKVLKDVMDIEDIEIFLGILFSTIFSKHCGAHAKTTSISYAGATVKKGPSNAYESGERASMSFSFGESVW